MTAGQTREVDRIRARMGRVRTRSLNRDVLAVEVLGDLPCKAPRIIVALAPSGRAVCTFVPDTAALTESDALVIAELERWPVWRATMEIASELGRQRKSVGLQLARLARCGHIDANDQPYKGRRYRAREEEPAS